MFSHRRTNVRLKGVTMFGLSPSKKVGGNLPLAKPNEFDT